LPWPGNTKATVMSCPSGPAPLQRAPPAGLASCPGRGQPCLFAGRAFKSVPSVPAGGRPAGRSHGRAFSARRPVSPHLECSSLSERLEWLGAGPTTQTRKGAFMPLYEHVYLARQDVTTQQVDELTAQFKGIVE